MLEHPCSGRWRFKSWVKRWKRHIREHTHTHSTQHTIDHNGLCYRVHGRYWTQHTIETKKREREKYSFTWNTCDSHTHTHSHQRQLRSIQSTPDCRFIDQQPLPRRNVDVICATHMFAYEIDRESFVAEDEFNAMLLSAFCRLYVFLASFPHTPHIILHVS